MKRRAFVSSLAAWPVATYPLPTSEEQKIRAIAEGFLREHGIQGMSIAYGRDGKIDFEGGYGFADADGKEKVTPQHRFRIASISKPITATAVMKCIEEGRLKPESTVFGPQGILGGDYSGEVAAITVDQLLTHTSGGWANDRNDPMFQNPQMNHAELIAWALTNQKQTHKPGEHFAYSNFGYCVLGRVLEKVYGQPYETLIQKRMLEPCGISSMQIGGNTLAERRPQEVMYVTPKPGAAYSMNVSRMDSHGGWISKAGDLVRFTSQLSLMLKPESIRAMTTPGVGGGYARGWNVNKVPNWWHTGSLPGTTTIMVHTAKGRCWAGLLNGRSEGLGLALDKLMWQMGGVVKAWEL
ncbi:serine hydrolase domain-containing protein [Prosthecobacter vanneervenii]|uniref:CubicO group peptidase (Beta-lactamase class C family) n=1 Tax=Prosthecobacter vanneervenii TaxID=48466 RepID=A0A7W8DLH6_9BACT|nr:serine hydrolase domain-containing protein [Prosthecobacter vanneervenii]MBB5034157.1 CubicO group peptidase (beta-lactamase class C family) [Prosthecobacter vanneervenii]